MTEAIQTVVSGAEKRRQALLEARRRDSETKRAHVRDTVEKMLLAGERISFAAVARQAKVSNWLVYADGVREHIQGAMRQQDEEPSARADGRGASTASLLTDLALARNEIKHLRAEHENLRQKAQRLLGQQLGQVHVDELRQRIDALVDENGELASSLERTTTEKSALKARVAELEDDLAAARMSLRRMIRMQSAGIEGE